MKISAKSEYAVLALLYIYEESAACGEEHGLNGGESPVSIQAICRRQSFPKELLGKILQQLVAVGILRSMRGQYGGFIPCRPSDKVSLLDIVSLFEPRAYLNNCTTDTMLCLSQPTCRLASAWQKAQVVLDEQLRKTTYATLLSTRPKGGLATSLTVIGLGSKRQLAISK